MARRNPASSIALGGVLAALAVVILCMGTLIPVATFVCPMLCMLLLKAVLSRCGDRVGWAWYGAVAVLGALLAPDKEAAAVFVFLGFYPIIKPKMEMLPAKWLWKVLYSWCQVLLLLQQSLLRHWNITLPHYALMCICRVYPVHCRYV